jgi:hypothetical protein
MSPFDRALRSLAPPDISSNDRLSIAPPLKHERPSRRNITGIAGIQ